eukprot:TRINITY_DN2470_c1_g1_i6.p2 TRINITY_DN2470_c1_g1~~TRINITY_DN2470_c1_g1_i6.p2  ORF type:complete len:117 (-),score=1.50 TRINITY_DN2470_c1_g1_i6:78-428(-)
MYSVQGLQCSQMSGSKVGRSDTNVTISRQFRRVMFANDCEKRIDLILYRTRLGARLRVRSSTHYESNQKQVSQEFNNHQNGIHLNGTNGKVENFAEKSVDFIPDRIRCLIRRCSWC